MTTKKKTKKVVEMSAKEYIVRRIREKILLNWNDWVDNRIAMIANMAIDTPEARKKVEAGKHNLKEIQARIDWLNVHLEEELAKSDEKPW